MPYRIDELARAAGTTVRNVRAYQDRGLLPPPRREGRVGLYDDAHLARLRMIGALLERGYSLGNIAELLESWESGRELGDVLGFEEALTSPFSEEPEGTITLPELAKMFEGADPTSIAQAVKLGLLVPDGAVFRVRSPRVLRAGAELTKMGLPLRDLLHEIAALRRDVDRIAERFVALVIRDVFDKYGDGMPSAEDTPKLAEMIRRMRPIAELVVDSELARALEQHIRAQLGERLGRLLETKKKRKTAAK